MTLGRVRLPAFPLPGSVKITPRGFGFVLVPMTAGPAKLQRNFTDILKEAGDSPVAVISRNRSGTYVLSATRHGRLSTYLEKSERTASFRPFPL